MFYFASFNRSLVSCWSFFLLFDFFARVYTLAAASAATATTIINLIGQELSLHIWTDLQWKTLCVQLNSSILEFYSLLLHHHTHLGRPWILSTGPALVFFGWFCFRGCCYSVLLVVLCYFFRFFPFRCTHRSDAMNLIVFQFYFNCFKIHGNSWDWDQNQTPRSKSLINSSIIVILEQFDCISIKYIYVCVLCEYHHIFLPSASMLFLNWTKEQTK